MVFVLVNLGFALALMEADMFSFLNSILGFYSNCAIAWVVTVATDIGVNKYLLNCPRTYPSSGAACSTPSTRWASVSFVAASGLSIAMYFHAFGDALQPYSPVAAAVIAFVLTPLMAVATKGAYYLRRTDDGIPEPLLDADGNPSAITVRLPCLPTTLRTPRCDGLPATHDAVVCSLCLSTDRVGDHVLPAGSAGAELIA